MFGISAAYIEATKGISDINMRKLIRYCIVDVYATVSLTNKLNGKFFK